jgi:hypothetical protein
LLRSTDWTKTYFAVFKKYCKSTVLRKIFGPVKIGVWSIGTKQELTDVSREPDIISEIGKGKYDG